MTMKQLETDYLIIGAGAVGMAFADVILSETNASIILVDMHHKPGGHWNDAYSFVTLHQPSAFYGVSSKELSKGRRDEIGLNKGLHELASGSEVLAYFDQVMKHTFLPSGRVQYFPMHQYLGDQKFKSMIADDEYQVDVKTKVIDATYYQTSVPATHTPNFEIADGVEFAPLNELPNLNSPRDGYVIVGGGKTGIDACLWLLENHVNADDICWIMPRDGWWINRQYTQPSVDFLDDLLKSQLTQMSAIADSQNFDELFAKLEAGGVLMRLDSEVKPEMFHGATVSQDEAKLLRTIKNVVRLGRVQRIEQDQIILEQGNIPSSAKHIHIDCSARAVPVTESYKVFDDKLVTLQTVRSYQPVFSAAFVAHIEANYDDESIKNDLCSLVPLPNHDTDWLLGMAAQMKNQFRWSQEPGLRNWLITNRLDGFTALMTPNENTTPQQMMILGQLKEIVPKAAANLPKLLAQIPPSKVA